jgi:hypothetical protein
LSPLRPNHQILADLSQERVLSSFEELLVLRLHTAVDGLVSVNPEHRALIVSALDALAASLRPPRRRARGTGLVP